MVDKMKYANLNEMEGNKHFKQLKDESQEFIDPRNLQIDSMYLSVSGVIESGICEDEQTLQVRYSIEHGENGWKKIAGQLAGESQTSSSYSLYVRDIVFNFPFDCTFSTVNPHGWPQIVLTVKDSLFLGPDIFGRSQIKGYGSVHFPTEPGYHERTVRLYKPIPMSLFSGFIGYLIGQSGEYYNAEKVISKGEGRDVTRVKSVGTVKVKFQVMKRNFKRYGYS